jgi:phosphoribosylformimino-5-aminoimidazole carboxamide ribotide isomerase
MQIWPAIDLRGGKCVRLQQGDYGREMVFSENPADVARQLVEAGADCLHLVDLDGARDGKQVNLEVIRAIVTAVEVPCELGGGIRDEATIRAVIDEIGLARLIIGTRAVREPDWFRKMIQMFPGKLVLGIDARDGLVATDGWIKTSAAKAIDFAKQFEEEPLAAIIYTDISRDGMLNGPNVDANRAMKEAVRLPVVASGGVTSAADVAALAKIPMAGCIIGRALYEGKIKLEEALAAARNSAPMANHR